MSDRMTYRLWEPVQAHKALHDAWAWCKAMLVSGHELEFVARKATRSIKQNALLHAVLGDISKQLEWAGKKRDVETWKRLLVAAWLRARGESLEMLPAVDGHGVDIVFRRTSELTRAECSELTEYIMAWAIDKGVALRDAQQWQVDAETGEILA